MSVKDFQRKYFDCIRYGSKEFRVLPLEEAESRLSIYSHQFLFNHYEILQKIFPVTQKFLGSENFRFFCKEYIEAFPNQSIDLHLYGQGFGGFLDARDEVEYDFLRDLMDLEWNFHAAYYLGSDFKKIITSEFPLYDLYFHIKEESPLESPEAQSVMICLKELKPVIELSS